MKSALTDGSSVAERVKPAAEQLRHKAADGLLAVLRGIGLETFTKREKSMVIAKTAIFALMCGTLLGAKFGSRLSKYFRP